jgi:hypothetical protein
MLEGHILSGGFLDRTGRSENNWDPARKESALTSERKISRNSGSSRSSGCSGASGSHLSHNEDGRSIPESRGLRSADDEVLVDWLREGDRAAFDELYRRYFRRVYGFLDKRLRNRAYTE